MTGQDLISVAKDERNEDIEKAAKETLKSSLSRIDVAKKRWENQMEIHNKLLSMSVYDLASYGRDEQGCRPL